MSEPLAMAVNRERGKGQSHLRSTVPSVTGLCVLAQGHGKAPGEAMVSRCPDPNADSR
jgi:hypothetical protein